VTHALAQIQGRRDRDHEANPNRNVPGGIYEVTKQLPGNGGECEYRIKSATEPHERVARETELTKA
jgi:hypothetical protein